jgi:hypothetical protein
LKGVKHFYNIHFHPITSEVELVIDESDEISYDRKLDAFKYIELPEEFKGYDILEFDLVNSDLEVKGRVEQNQNYTDELMIKERNAYRYWITQEECDKIRKDYKDFRRKMIRLEKMNRIGCLYTASPLLT